MSGEIATGASDETVRHIPKFSGEIWYVSSTGSDTNSGKIPDCPFLTIGKAITSATADDAIQIKAGTYTEVGLDVNKESVELWCEIGAIIAPASGTVLTVSAATCRIKGTLQLTPVAGENGLAVSGIGGEFEGIKVSGTSIGNGFYITGNGNEFTQCHAMGMAATYKGFAVVASQNKLIRCHTRGTTTSFGFHFSGTKSMGYLIGCTSAGHQSGGYYFGTGVSLHTIKDCSSGSGDGARTDFDNANVWSNYTFDNNVYKRITFTDATQSFPLFTVTGIVEVEELYGHVESALNGEMGTCRFRLYGSDGATDSDLTTATSCVSLPVGSFLGKIADTGKALRVGSSAAPVVVENTNFRTPRTSSIIVSDNTGITQIEFYSNDAAGNKAGIIHFHCKWRPISDDSLVKPVV